jgi:large subunit ribosomal protein L22
MSNLEAHHNFARIAARKARYVADLVRGQDVNAALDILHHTHRRGSMFLSRLLKSAIANATQTGDVNANRLYISDLQIDSGPLLQGRFRYQSGPMGRALPIRKRTSHIHLILAERGEGKEGAKKRGAKAAAGKGAGKGGDAGEGTKAAGKSPADKSPADKKASPKKTAKAAAGEKKQ